MPGRARRGLMGAAGGLRFRAVVPNLNRSQPARFWRFCSCSGLPLGRQQARDASGAGGDPEAVRGADGAVDSRASAGVAPASRGAREQGGLCAGDHQVPAKPLQGSDGGLTPVWTRVEYSTSLKLHCCCARILTTLQTLNITVCFKPGSLLRLFRAELQNNTVVF